MEPIAEAYNVICVNYNIHVRELFLIDPDCFSFSILCSNERENLSVRNVIGQQRVEGRKRERRKEKDDDHIISGPFCNPSRFFLGFGGRKRREGCVEMRQLSR